MFAAAVDPAEVDVFDEEDEAEAEEDTEATAAENFSLDVISAFSLTVITTGDSTAAVDSGPHVTAYTSRGGFEVDRRPRTPLLPGAPPPPPPPPPKLPSRRFARWLPKP